MIRKIVAIDPGPTRTGIAIFLEDGTLDEVRVMINPMFYDIRRFVHREGPDEVVIEEQVNHNRKSSQAVARVRYSFEVMCEDSDIPVKTVHPKTWRAYSEIKDKTDKTIECPKLVKKLYGISVGSDEADAILIGRWYMDNFVQQEEEEDEEGE